jgi:hypothetical protein
MQRLKRVLADNVLISLPIVVHLASTRARRWFGKGHTPEAFSCVLVRSRAFSCVLVMSASPRRNREHWPGAGTPD